MNFDLIHVFNDAQTKLETWKNRYTPAEYPYKIVLNIFYRKYAMESMFDRVLRLRFPDVNTAMISVSNEYQEECLKKMVNVVEPWMLSNRKVGMIKYSDFESFIRSAAQGNQDALRGIEYTYRLHRIIDGLILVWMSVVTTGKSKTESITRVTNAVIAEMPINNYETIESIIDQLGAENYLRTLIMRSI